MIWLVLRRQRAALLLTAGMVVAMAVILVAGRLHFLAEGTELGLLPCITDPLTGCEGEAWRDLGGRYRWYWALIHVALVATPALLGVIAGAGLFGRELDQSTHVLALTQSISRVRWWLTGLLVAGTPTLVAIALLNTVATWGLEHFDEFGQPMTSPRYEVAGILPAAHAVLAFAVAASVGILMRRTETAIVVTLVLQVVLLWALATSRADFLPAEENVIWINRAENATTEEIPPNAWQVRSEMLDAQGNIIAINRVIAGCAAQTAADSEACPAESKVVAIRQIYHPAERFWPLQLIESGILAVLAAAALAVGYVGLRRKVS